MKNSVTNKSNIDMQETSCILECPICGPIKNKYITTIKTCGKCMERDSLDASRAPRLLVKF